MKTNKVIFFLLALAVCYACPMWGSPDDDGEKDKTVNTDNILKPITPIDTAGISIIKDPTIHIVSEPVNNISNYDVGSPKGAFSVNGSGSAIYKISIEAPNGGSLSPSIGVSYNSQSGNGLAVSVLTLLAYHALHVAVEIYIMTGKLLDSRMV